MRILLVHNSYGSTAPSGENKVFEAERTMLEKHGERVNVYTRHSDEIRLVARGGWLGGGLRKAVNLVKGALCTVGNPFAAWEMGKKIRAFKPEVVHFHNQFPLISPLSIRTAHRSGAKVVMTLHNYRTVCAAGVPTRCGKVCTECFLSEKANVHPEATATDYNLSVWPALHHRCYRGSLLATVPLAINIWLYRKCWAKWVDCFIALSEFQRDRMIECGFPAEKICVKGNFVEGKVSRVGRGECVEKKNQVLFIGRLSDEKGVKTLIAAWRALQSHHQPQVANYQLNIVGDGDQRAEYEELAKGLNVRFLGLMRHEVVLDLMAESRCIVQPSACWETFGLTVAEAMSVGTPAVVSNVGALPDLVGNGAVRGECVEHGECGEIFEVGNAESLADAVRRIITRKDYCEVCETCRKRVAERYTEESNYRQLKEIYAHLANYK